MRLTVDDNRSLEVDIRASDARRQPTKDGLQTLNYHLWNLVLFLRLHRESVEPLLLLHGPLIPEGLPCREQIGMARD